MIGGIAAGIVVFNAEKERLENNICCSMENTRPGTTQNTSIR